MADDATNAPPPILKNLLVLCLRGQNGSIGTCDVKRGDLVGADPTPPIAAFSRYPSARWVSPQRLGFAFG